MARPALHLLGCPCLFDACGSPIAGGPAQRHQVTLLDRFQTAAALYAALEPLATLSVGITSATARPLAVTSAWRRKNILIGGLVLVAIGVITLLSRGRAAPLAAVTPVSVRLTFNGLQWLNDGDIVTAIEETRGSYALHRIGRKGGARRVDALPYSVGRGYRFARDGQRRVVSLSEPHSDVWLVKTFGKMFGK